MGLQSITSLCIDADRCVVRNGFLYLPTDCMGV